MAAAESYVARFECSVCQGTAPHESFVALSCGHCFHSDCISSWLARAASCPACRANASKRQLRVLTGIDVVAVDSFGQQQEHHHDHQHHVQQQEQLSQLQSELEATEQHVQELSDTVQQLADVQAELDKKYRHYKHRCGSLEAQRLQDSQRLSGVTEELNKYREAHRTMQARLEAEQQKRRKAESDLLSARLANPSLSLACLERMLGQKNDQDLLLPALAQRNEQLKQAEVTAARLQQQLQQEQAAFEEQLSAAVSGQRAAEVRAAKAREAGARQANRYEAEVHMLQQENKELQQQLSELHGVLLAMEGGQGVAQRRQQQQQQQPQQQANPQQQQPQQPARSHHGDAVCSSPTAKAAAKAEVAAAVGPGGLLQSRPGSSWAQVPSFAKAGPGRAEGGGLQVQGQLLRHGPDGRGATVKHLPTTGKRGLTTKGGAAATAANKRLRGCSITSFFGKA